MVSFVYLITVVIEIGLTMTFGYMLGSWAGLVLVVALGMTMILFTVIIVVIGAITEEMVSAIEAEAKRLAEVVRDGDT